MTEQTEQDYLNGPDDSGARRVGRAEAAARGIEAFERWLREKRESEGPTGDLYEDQRH